MTLIRQLTILAVLGVIACGCVQIPIDSTNATLRPAQNRTVDAEAFFCPRDQCEQRMVSAIGSAKESVNAAIYSFTSQEIAGALARAKGRGVRVKVVVDALQAAGENSVADDLKRAGIEVRIFPKGTTMHNKFAVIDNSLAITGSFNWTKNAAYYNRENFIMLFDMGITADYEKEFFRLWIEAA